MREILLLKLGEMVLKGLNRNRFENNLFKHIDRVLHVFGQYERRYAQSTVYILPKDDGFDMDGAAEAASRVFGLASVCRAAQSEKNLPEICSLAQHYLSDALMAAHSFKVEARRSDKNFPLNSMEIMSQVGGFIQESFNHLRVDAHTPDITVFVEIRDFAAYVHRGSFPGAGGLPAGTAGRATLMLSGGLDSPVAGYMLAKRGVELEAVHFCSPPYTSARAVDKVRELAGILSRYCGCIRLHIVHTTEIQEFLRDNAPGELNTLLLRRFMMRIAESVASGSDSGALITGESLGQVASQTLAAIGATNEVCRMPVFRPLIGMDKNEIVTLAHKIGTYETSIRPYEDCCTLFTPKHPRLRPRPGEIEGIETGIDIPALIDRAMDGLSTETIG